MTTATDLSDRIRSVTTAHLADACIMLRCEVRCGPASLRPAVAAARFAGPVQPVRHTGSVDIILEGIDAMPDGAVLVIDDDGREDRACIGDLTVLEAKLAGAAAMVVNGLHRDTAELAVLQFPVLSLGSSPTGPLEWFPRAEGALERCRLGAFSLTGEDFIVADQDGIIMLPLSRLDEIVAAAEVIRNREHAQAERAVAGVSLREQFGFDAYLARRDQDPSWTFRRHLAERSASIEA